MNRGRSGQPLCGDGRLHRLRRFGCGDRGDREHGLRRSERRPEVRRRRRTPYPGRGDRGRLRQAARLHPLRKRDRRVRSKNGGLLRRVRRGRPRALRARDLGSSRGRTTPGQRQKLRLASDGSKLKLHKPEEHGLNAPRRRRNRDPYAESFRERHAVGINAVKRWAKRVVFVAVLYGMYLLAIYLMFPWGQVVQTPTGPQQTPGFSISAANGFLPGLLIRLGGFGTQLAFFALVLIIQFVALFWFLSRGRTYVIYPGEYDVSFRDVRGQKAAVEATQEVVRLFQGFKKFRKMGGYPPQGILLEGPPGTGKTLLSKAIAGEVNVPFIYASASSFNNMFMGVSNLRVMRLFSKARKFSERFGGAVIFMDELDAIGSRGGVAQTMEPYPFDEPFRHGLEDRLISGPPEEPRRRGSILGFVDGVFAGGMNMGMGGMLVNELLVQMDGLEQPKGLRRLLRCLIPLFIRKRLKRKVPTYNILVIGATNRADSLDPALLRPGRFDRRLHVGLPDKEGRIDIADYYLKNVIHEALIFALQDGRDSLSWPDIWSAKLTDEIGLKQPVEYNEEEKVKIA